MTREELLGRLFWFIETILPHDAQTQGWEIDREESFLRVILDYLVEDEWEKVLDRSHVIYDQLSDEQLARAVALAEYLAEGGAARAAEMNRQSLIWRGKLVSDE